MIIKEYRIILPISLEDYQIAHLWATLEAEKMETGGGEGFEIIANEPRDFESGPCQYTHKVLHLFSKVPRSIRALAPKGSLELHQISKNSYPHVETTMNNPDYTKDNFYVKVESQHKEDYGELENVHGLNSEELHQREVVFIDFVSDKLDPRDYAESEDPAKFVPTASKLGKLSANWLEDMKNGKHPSVPHVCVYKVVRVEFKWFNLQAMVEKRIHKFFRRYMMNFHRRLYCCMDRWNGLKIDDVRALEEKTKKELVDMRVSEEVRGMSEK